MVKIPEEAPRGLHDDFTKNLPEKAVALQPIVDKANAAYVYWDKFKQWPMPDNIRPQDAWVFLKLMRRANRRYLPLVDVNDHRFSYILTEESERCLHFIDKWAGGWDAGAQSSGLPNQDSRERYLVNGLIEEAIASSQLEGAATTRKRARQMLLNNEKPRDFNEKMILNNFRTINHLRQMTSSPLSPEMLLELQEMLTVDTLRNSDDVGAFRSDNDIIVGDEQGRILYTPPDFKEIPGRLDALCQYANDDGPGFVHPVIRAIVLHFWLALVHPFADGNGRTARALFYWFMLKSGYWPFEYLAISRSIKRAPAQYQRAYLYAEIDDCDFTYFLTFNLRIIESALKDFHSYANRKAREDQRLRNALEHDFDLNYRQRAVLSRALKNPDAAFTITSHRTAHGVVYATARGDLYDLEDRGYLVRHRSGRQYVFLPAPNLRDFLSESQG